MTKYLLAVIIGLMAFSGWQTWRLMRLQDAAQEAYTETKERMDAVNIDTTDSDAVLERLRALGSE